MMNDTIAAIATADGMGAISIIRISGDQAIEITGKLIHKDLKKAKGYTIHHGYIYDGDEQVDEVLVSVYRNPHSYTGEESVEIACHGGRYITRRVLSVILGSGIRLARHGEFTERAFLNGKMDLSQAEGVDALIRAKDQLNAKSALHSLKGSVKKLLDPLEEELTQMISNIEVNIDYPEYDDVHILTTEELLPLGEKWITEIDQLIKETKQAMFIREGIETVIVGVPNVGKSSLLNALLEENKAIVTDIAGTTRDLVEGSVKVGDLTLNLVDTAGVHDAQDQIEQAGIDRSMQAIQKAQLVIVVLDASRSKNEDDEKILELTKDMPRLIVYNKSDIHHMDNAINISAMNKDIDELKDAIQKMYEEDLIVSQSDTLNNERQLGLAMQAKTSVQKAVEEMKEDTPLDLVIIELEDAWHSLREITGKATKEDLLDEIFSRFCLGK